MKLDTFLNIKYAYAYGSNKWRDASLKDLDKARQYNIPINTAAGLVSAAGGGTLSHILLGKNKWPLSLAIAAAGGLGAYSASKLVQDSRDATSRAKIYAINKQYNNKHKIKSLFNN